MAHRPCWRGTTVRGPGGVHLPHVADSFFRAILRRLMPDRTASAPTTPAAPNAEPSRPDAEDSVLGLRVDPRARHIESLERSASSAGFERLRVGGLPHWADAIAKRREPDTPVAVDERIDPSFDRVASLSCSADTRLALGPSVRRALLEALDHTPAVRLGDGFVEAIVPYEKASEPGVQDAVLSIARAFTGPPEPLDRILRWTLEDDSPALRHSCLLWLIRHASHTPRTWDVLRASLTQETDDAVRLDAASALGNDARSVIEQIAERPNSAADLRARAILMLPSVCDDDARLDRLLLGGVKSGPEEVRSAALEAIVSARRLSLVPTLVLLLTHGKSVADALIRLGEAASARAALAGARSGEDVSVTLERIRIAAELGGKEVVEPLRAFLSAGNPRELATPTRNAIEKVKSRLNAVDGGLSIAETDERGRLSPAAEGGELSTTTGAGALSEPTKKRS